MSSHTDGEHRPEAVHHRHRHKHHYSIRDIDRHRSANHRREGTNFPSIKSPSTRDPNHKVEISPISLSKDEKAASELYSVDRRGDIQNLTYRSLSQYEIPRYRTAGYGRILGLGPRFRISRDTQLIEEIQPDPSSRSRRGIKSLLTATAEGDEPLLSLTIKSDDEAIEEQHDFVSVDRARPRRVRTDFGGPLERRDAGDSDDSSVSIPESTGEQETYSSFVANEKTQRSIQLNRAVRDNPEDIESWLDLADLQRTRGMLAIDVYERALAVVKSIEGRRKLYTLFLQDARSIWDSAKLFAKWESVLKETGPDNIDLWLKYLNLRQTTLSEFTIDGLLALHLECLRMTRSLQDPMACDQNCSYLLLRCTRLLQRAGFLEKALAIWQALLEWVFFTPVRTTDNEDELLAVFEGWWASEVPRVGEVGAKGWNNSDAAEPQSHSDPELIPRPKLENRFQRWASTEEEYARGSKLPARTLDVTRDDPFRIVLFSDVKEYLQFRPVTPAGHQVIIDAFLVFCNLPPRSDQARRWWIDPFLRNVKLGYCQETRELSASNDTLTPSNCVVDTFTMFVDPRTGLSCWPDIRSSNGEAGSTDDDIHAIDTKWTQRVLRQLIAVHQEDTLAEYVVAFELTIDPSTARKYARSLLKKCPDSLLLYNAFAQIESRLGNHDSAHKVWETALTLKPKSDPSLELHTLLWWNYVWDFLTQKDYGRATDLLLSVADEKPQVAVANVLEPAATSSHRHLRTQQFLKLQISSQLALGNFRAAIKSVDLLAIYTYLTTTHSVAAAAGIYEAAYASLSQGSAAPSDGELLYQSLIRLVCFHGTTPFQPLPPSEASRILQLPLGYFPENSMFLKLQTRVASQKHLSDRLRTFSASYINGSDKSRNDRQSTAIELGSSNLISSVSSITTELARPDFGGRTEHSVRAAFARALIKDTSPSHVSPSFWLNYLYWEASLSSFSTGVGSQASPETKRQKQLRDLFYQALRISPYSKSIYLFAFQSEALRHALGEAKLMEIYDTMIETGIRLHHELD